MRKTMAVMIMFAIAALCLVPLGYAQPSDKTTIQDVKQETQNLISKLKNYTADQRDEAVKETEQGMKNLDNRIDELETYFANNWDKMDAAAREDAQTGMKELRKQRNELSEWYGSLKNSSASSWDRMKKGFSDAYQSLVDTWAKVKSKY